MSATVLYMSVSLDGFIAGPTRILRAAMTKAKRAAGHDMHFRVPR